MAIFKSAHFRPTSIIAGQYSNELKMVGVNFDHFYRIGDSNIGDYVAVTFPNDYRLIVSYNGSSGWNGKIFIYSENSTSSSPKGYVFKVADAESQSRKEWIYNFEAFKTYKFVRVADESSTKRNIRIINGGFIIDTKNRSVKTQGNINNKLVETISSNFKKLNFEDNWKWVVSNIDGVENTISVEDGTTFKFYKNGYIVNRDGNNNAYTQSFEYSPLHLKYVKHWDHAIGHEQTLLDLRNFKISATNNAGRKHYKFLVRICTGVATSYIGSPSFYGMVDAYIEFSWDGIDSRTFNFVNMRLKSAEKHDNRITFYIAGVSNIQDLREHRITNTWKHIGSINANLSNSYWAQWFIKNDNGLIKIAMKCDFHGADRNRFGIFAPTDLWITDESQVKISENCGLSSAKGKFTNVNFNQNSKQSYGILPTSKDSILVADSLDNWVRGSLDHDNTSNPLVSNNYVKTNIKQSLSNSGIYVPETGWRACKYSLYGLGLYCLNKDADYLLSASLVLTADNYDFTRIRKVSGLKQQLKAVGATDEDVTNLRDITFAGLRVYFLTNKSLFSAKVNIGGHFTDFKKENAIGNVPIRPDGPHGPEPQEWTSIGVIDTSSIFGAQNASRNIFIASTYSPHFMEGKVDEDGNLLFLERLNFADVGTWTGDGATCISFDHIRGWNSRGLIMRGTTAQSCLVSDMIKMLNYNGYFSTVSKENIFNSITTFISSGQFSGEYALTGIILNDVTSIGARAFMNSPLKHIEIQKATTIGDEAFIAVERKAHIWMNKKFDTVSEKNRIFGVGNWDQITFHWTEGAVTGPVPTIIYNANNVHPAADGTGFTIPSSVLNKPSFFNGNLWIKSKSDSQWGNNAVYGSDHRTTVYTQAELNAFLKNPYSRSGGAVTADYRVPGGNYGEVLNCQLHMEFKEVNGGRVVTNLSLTPHDPQYMDWANKQVDYYKFVLTDIDGETLSTSPTYP